MTQDHYKIVHYPIISEKGTMLQESGRQYLFRVDRGANKIQIRKAVQALYKVKVERVNTMIVRGKRRRIRNIAGKRPDWKKAIVTLKAGQSIDFT